MNTNLCGIYQISQSILHKSESESFSLVICTRKVATPQKPIKYLLYKPKEGKSVYLSSLYPNGQEGAENGFMFEVDGVYYKLALDRENNQATISLLSTQNPMISINNMGFGVKFTPPLPKKRDSDNPKNS
jgi:hypothetical protein